MGLYEAYADRPQGCPSGGLLDFVQYVVGRIRGVEALGLPFLGSISGTAPNTLENTYMGALYSP